MRREQGYDYLVKLLIIGNSGVGKTNLLLRFCQNNFLTSHLSTIGKRFPTQALILKQKCLPWEGPELSYKYGIRQVSNALKRSPKLIIEERWGLFLLILQTIEIPLMIYKIGSSKLKLMLLQTWSKCQWAISATQANGQSVSTKAKNQLTSLELDFTKPAQNKI